VGLKKMSKQKDRTGMKKKNTGGAGRKEDGYLQGEDDAYQAKSSNATYESSESMDLTERLKAAFHEKPKEDKELERRKELDQTCRDFRKSFRQEVTSEVKHISDQLVTGVKDTITTIKTAAKLKKKEEGDERALN
jgi:hypothetical protein